jgi:putative membrane protein
MGPVIESLMTGMPVLIAHFLVAISIFVAGVFVYTRITPFNELALIRQGNAAAGVSALGATLGLALPIAGALAGSVNLFDLVVWGTLALMIQILTFVVVSLAIKRLVESIMREEMAAAILLAGVQVAVGLINAAAVRG